MKAKIYKREGKYIMRERNIIIIMLTIIIILLLAFLLVNHLGTIDVKAPTGNVDIYDITIIEKEETANNEDKIIVHDEDGLKLNEAPLKIFEHKSYHIKNDVIAPGSENSYQFVIRNNNEFAIIYDLEIKETNKYGINMKFRLKQNEKYILGNDNKWVSAEELRQSEVILANDSYNVYTLDWKWFESENDTDIGEDIESDYKLDISFNSNRY